jgi:hypothetical protein
MEFEYSFSRLAEEDIKKFEDKYEIKLPKAYKEFLLLHNGGKPVIRRFKTAEGTMTSSVMLFFPLSEETEFNLENYYRIYTEGSIVPSNMMPIGIDPADSLICLQIEDEDKVYFCDMDYFEEDEELRKEFILLVADNFSTFLNNLFTS